MVAISSRWGEAENGRKRKYYSITKRGQAALVERRAEWSTFVNAVNTLLMLRPV